MIEHGLRHVLWDPQIKCLSRLSPSDIYAVAHSLSSLSELMWTTDPVAILTILVSLSGTVAKITRHP
jgi:hypothetical protein